MADKKTIYVRFTQDVSGTKLRWLKQELDDRDIDWRVHGTGMRGELIQVNEKHLHDANAILETFVGDLSVGTTNHRLSVDDLPNEHEYFLQGLYAPKDDLGSSIVSDDDDDDDFFSDLETPAFVPEPKLKGIPGNVTEDGQDRDLMWFEVNSSNLSMMAFLQSHDPEKGTLYMRFKSGFAPYRYNPVPSIIWDELYEEAIQSSKGTPDASVGSMFHKLIKVPTEEGKINCWKLDDDGAGWEVVPRRSERAKKILKNANL